MPITYWTFLVGCLALIGFPGTSGFFSKDAIDRRGGASHRVGAGYAYFCVLTGVFITALYTFRMFFMTFHGKGRMDHHTEEHLHESPWVVTAAAGSAGDPLGRSSAGSRSKPVLFGNFFGGAIHVLPANDVLDARGRGISWLRRLEFWSAATSRCRLVRRGRAC